MSVYLSVSVMSVRSPILETIRRNFTKFSLRVNCGRIARSFCDDNAIRYVRFFALRCIWR